VPDARDHAKTVLSAIIPRRRDLLETALLKLTPDHFPDKSQSNLFQLLERYSDGTGGVLTRLALEDLMRGRDAGVANHYYELYDLFAEREVEDSEFLWSIQQLRELAADKATGEVLSEAMEILVNGKEIEGGDALKGNEEARAYALEAFANIDRDLTMQEAPEGDMREERNDMVQDYIDRKKLRESGVSQGIEFGISELDEKTGGMQAGELVLIAGYSSDGKTSLCVQTAWHASVMQGKNVVFLTTETLRPQVRRKLIARHSMLPLFEAPEGLNTRDLKAGTLSKSQEQTFKDVITDFTKNPEYGKLYIAQVHRSSTITSIEQTLYRIQRRFNIDLVVCDYLQLLKADRNRNDDRQELSSVVKNAKQVAATFDNGRGVAFMSPWQVNRAARDKAESVGHYTSSALAETAEATNTADLIVSVFAPTDNSNRHAEVKGQILKSRDGETTNSLLMSVDYATSTFTSKPSMGFGPALGGSTSSGGITDDYLDD
jgi:replicative DNA helicase